MFVLKRINIIHQKLPSFLETIYEKNTSRNSKLVQSIKKSTIQFVTKKNMHRK